MIIEAPKEEKTLEKELTERFFRGEFIHQFKYTLDSIYEYMMSSNKKISEVIEEVKNKKSPLTKSQRDFMMYFKPDFIEDLMNDFVDLKRLKSENK